MNKFLGIGRLVKDPEVRYSQGENSLAVGRYTLAVDRKNKKDGQQTADFISCVVFGKAAEFTEKYLHKGTKIAVVGRIQTGSYTNKDGQKVYTTDVVVEEQEFAESKGSNNSGNGGVPSNSSPSDIPGSDGFMNIPNGIQEELPF